LLLHGGLQALWARPYWTRLRVLEEFLLAENPSFHGRHQASQWKELSQYFRYLENNHEDQVTSIFKSAERSSDCAAAKTNAEKRSATNHGGSKCPSASSSSTLLTCSAKTLETKSTDC
jgi:hypothetical protein